MSPEAFIIENMFMISNKDGEDVDFKLNSAQKKLDSRLTGRDLVPKARQEGVSAYFLARFLVACLKKRNTRAVVISHDKDGTQRLLARVRYYMDNIKGPRPVTKTESKNEISFPAMNSSFYIGTAGSKNFGRGDTITHLHCSEYAFWPNPKDIMTGLLQAVPYSGEIAIESTGNGYNDYYSKCMRAEKQQSLWTNHFLEWHTFPEYNIPLNDAEIREVMSNLVEDWEEPFLVENFKLSAGQIAWRRMKLDESDYDLGKFKQEYPMTLDECFQMSSESIFTKVRYVPSERWKRKGDNLTVLEGHPSLDCTYVQGADVAAGIGKDSSVSEVFCLETNEQVAEFISDRVDPKLFANKLFWVGMHFNKAFTVVEQNNHGILTLSELMKIYPLDKIFRDAKSATTSEEQKLFQLGYKTTVRNKPLMIGKLRVLLAETWTIYSNVLKSECSTFIEHENGRMAAQDGCHDDTVMAASCAATGMNRAALQAVQEAETPKTYTSPFEITNMLAELRSGKSGEWPIRPQADPLILH